MKLVFTMLYLLLALVSLGQEKATIRISTRWINDQEREIFSRSLVEAYSDQLDQIRVELRSSMATQDVDIQLVVKPALQALDAISERGDVNVASELLPFLDWLHANQDRPVAGSFENMAVKGTLNYVVDGIFGIKLRGGADVSDQDMEAMIRFYAGNPAQSSEGSWKTNNTLLFVFGNRVVDYLASKAPDRVAPFYQAVQDARDSELIGPDPDEEEIPEAERPTAEQLRNYEAAFARLEMLATEGVLPKADSPEAGNTASPQVPSHVQPPAPKKPVEQKLTPTTPSEKPSSPTRWPVVAVVVVAVLGLLWVLFKKRK